MKNKKGIKKVVSKYAFPVLGFLSGVGRVLDIGGTGFSFRYYRKNPEEADHAAIKSDWATIGDDMRNAFSDFEIQL